MYYVANTLAYYYATILTYRSTRLPSLVLDFIGQLGNRQSLKRKFPKASSSAGQTMACNLLLAMLKKAEGAQGVSFRKTIWVQLPRLRGRSFDISRLASNLSTPSLRTVPQAENKKDRFSKIVQVIISIVETKSFLFSHHSMYNSREIQN